MGMTIGKLIFGAVLLVLAAKKLFIPVLICGVSLTN